MHLLSILLAHELINAIETGENIPPLYTLPKMVYLHGATRKVTETEVCLAVSTVPGTQFMLSASAVAIT